MSIKNQNATIDCPKCSQVLPGWAERCQFCGYELAKGFARPVDLKQIQARNRMSWQEIAYITVSIIVILEGVYSVLQGLEVVPSVLASVGGGAFLGVVGAIQVGIGAGLLFQVEWIQFIAKLNCMLNLVMSSFGMLTSLMMRHPGAGLASGLFNITLYGFMLFLINDIGDV